MRAIVYDDPGDESVLHVGEVDPPRPGDGEIRIAVHATAVNRADILQRRGHYPPPAGASPVLGLECAGEVIETGPGVTRWKSGDRVMALLSGGGYAEEVVAPAGSAMPVPESFSWVEAGAVPEVFLTAWLNIFRIGGLQRGRKLLVHGGGSGVGTACLALCREAGIRIFVTCGTDEKCLKCRELGAEVAINYRTRDFADQVRYATGGAGVDLVLDSVGAHYLEGNLACLAPEGRLVVIGSMGGVRKAELDFSALMARRISITGSTLRTRPVAEKAAIVSG